MRCKFNNTRAHFSFSCGEDFMCSTLFTLSNCFCELHASCGGNVCALLLSRPFLAAAFNWDFN